MVDQIYKDFDISTAEICSKMGLLKSMTGRGLNGIKTMQKRGFKVLPDGNISVRPRTLNLLALGAGAGTVFASKFVYDQYQQKTVPFDMTVFKQTLSQ